MISRILNLFSVKLLARPFFWMFCATFLFVSSLSLSMIPDFFPLYFPFLLIALMGAVFFLRAIGFYLSLLCLSPFFYAAFKQNALWELSVLYSLAISYFIAMLALEEDVYLLSKVKEENPSQSQDKIEKEREDFQKMIDQLKDDAQRRYLEMSSLKEALSSFEKRHLQLEQDYQKEVSEKDHLLSALSELKEAQTKDTIEKEREDFQQMIDQLKDEAQRRYLEMSSLKETLSSFEKRHFQLEQDYQKEVSEKDHLLSTLSELKETRAAEISALQNQLSSKNEVDLESARQEALRAHEKIQEIVASKEALHQEMLLMREKLEEEKIKCHHLEKEMVNQKVEQTTASVSLEKHKELSDISGKYHQLREQFEEKSKVLSQTRKELFQAQTAILAQEKENAPSNLEFPKEEVSLLVALENQCEENAYLREEIIHLETLTSSLIYLNKD